MRLAAAGARVAADVAQLGAHAARGGAQVALPGPVAAGDAGLGRNVVARDDARGALVPVVGHEASTRRRTPSPRRATVPVPGS